MFKKTTTIWPPTCSSPVWERHQHHRHHGTCGPRRLGRRIHRTPAGQRQACHCCGGVHAWHGQEDAAAPAAAVDGSCATQRSGRRHVSPPARVPFLAPCPGQLLCRMPLTVSRGARNTGCCSVDAAERSTQVTSRRRGGLLETTTTYRGIVRRWRWQCQARGGGEAAPSGGAAEQRSSGATEQRGSGAPL